MPTKKPFVFVLILFFSLTACMSLAEDITPPPGMQAAPPSLDIQEPHATSTPLGPVFPQAPPDPRNGAPIYAEKCAPCHGDTGLGDGSESAMLENQAAPVGSADLARSSIPSDWYRLVTQGDLARFMPPFSNLNDQQRWDVIAYLYTLSSTPRIVQTGEGLYLENCTECHGEDGSQGGVDFSDPAFMSERSQETMFSTISSGQGKMPAFSDLSEDDRWILTAYLRSLSFVSSGVKITTESQVENVEAPEPDTVADNPTEMPSDAESAVDRLGTIKVSVVSRVGGDLPDMDITLRGYDEMLEVYTHTISLTGGTLAIFENTPLTSGRMYFASIEYGNAVYGSDILEIENNGSQSLELEITYYPPTTDYSILHVDRLHVFFSFVSEQILEVNQLYIFSNPTDQVLIPVDGAETAVNFTIPTNASNLYVEENMSMAYRKTEDGFGIVNVYPDENAYQAVFSYQVPYVDRKLDLTIPIGMDANAVIVMGPTNGFKVRSGQLVDAGTRDIEGVAYNMLTGSDLTTGSNLDINLSGTPKETTQFITTESDSNTSLVIGLAGLGVALIVAGLILWQRNRSEEGEWEQEDFIEDEIVDSIEDLMDAIIALDDLFRAGRLPEDAYIQRRAELKDKLRELMKKEE